MHTAAERGHLDVIIYIYDRWLSRILCAIDNDPDGNNRKEHEVLVDIVARGARTNHKSIVDFCLLNKEDFVNTTQIMRRVAIREASKNGHYALAFDLLDDNIYADDEKQDKEDTRNTRSSLLSLMLDEACARGHPDTVDVIFDKLRANAKDVAFRHGNSSVVNRLSR